MFPVVMRLLSPTRQLLAGDKGTDLEVGTTVCSLRSREGLRDTSVTKSFRYTTKHFIYGCWPIHDARSCYIFYCVYRPVRAVDTLDDGPTFLLLVVVTFKHAPSVKWSDSILFTAVLSKSEV